MCGLSDPIQRSAPCSYHAGCRFSRSLSLVVLMLYITDITGSALAVALLLLVGDFAPSLFAPLGRGDQ